MMQTERRDATDGPALERRVLFGDVSNVSLSKRPQVSCEPRCSLTTSEIRKKESGASFPLALSPTTPPTREKKMPFAVESPNHVDCRTPQQRRGDGGGARQFVRGQKPVFLSPEEKKAQNPRKCFRKYFFLKEFDALPMTPEEKKDHATSAPFRRLFACGPTAKTPQKRSGEKHKAPRFVCPSDLDSTARGAPSPPPSLRTAPRAGAGQNTSGGDTRQLETVAVRGRRIVAPTSCQEHAPGSVEEASARGAENLSITEKEKDQHAHGRDVAIAPRLGTESEGSSPSFFGLATEETSSGGDTPLHPHRVPLGPREPTPTTTTPSAQHSAFPLNDSINTPPVVKSDDTTVCVLFGEEESVAGDFARQSDPATEETTREEGSAALANFIPSMLTTAVGNFASVDAACHALSAFLACLFEEQFKEYQTRVLEAAFVVGCIHMVAVPAMKMLEFYGRRVVCMRRDIGIRNLIELFVRTLPHTYRCKGYEKSRHKNVSQETSNVPVWKKYLQPNPRAELIHVACQKRTLTRNKERDVLSATRRPAKGKDETVLTKLLPLTKKHQLPARVCPNDVARPASRKGAPKNKKDEDNFVDIIMPKLT